MPRGSKKGERRGGRKKGTPNKATAAKAAAVAASGLTPLDYLLGVMRNEQAPRDTRLEAARAAAPYVHPKLASIDHHGPGGGAIPLAPLPSDITDADAVKGYLELIKGK